MYQFIIRCLFDSLTSRKSCFVYAWPCFLKLNHLNLNNAAAIFLGWGADLGTLPPKIQSILTGVF